MRIGLKSICRSVNGQVRKYVRGLRATKSRLVALLIGRESGVRFYSQSISTNLDATAKEMKAVLMLTVFQLNITYSSPLFWKTRTRVRPKNSEKSLQGWDYKVSLPPNSEEKITVFNGILLITLLK